MVKNDVLLRCCCYMCAVLTRASFTVNLTVMNKLQARLMRRHLAREW